MGKGFSFQFNINNILAKRGLEPNGRIQQIIDSEVLKRCDPYVPLDQGVLKDSGLSNTEIGSGKIIYHTPYARKQYYIPMEHEGKRCAYWFEQMKVGGGKDAIFNIVKRETGAK